MTFNPEDIFRALGFIVFWVFLLVGGFIGLGMVADRKPFDARVIRSGVVLFLGCLVLMFFSLLR